MNVSEEIKRMMSLLESEMGNVKPLINEEGEEGVTAVNTPEAVLKQAMLAKEGGKSCWDQKGYVWDKQNPISKVNQNYLYALNKVDPNIKAGDSFVKIKADGIDVYMFGTPTTNPQYPGTYLAVTRNTKIPNFDKTKPNENYLEAHGWYCDTFKQNKNAVSQGELLTTSQSNAIKVLNDPKYIETRGYQFYTSNEIGDGLNYRKIDMATGQDEKGVQQIRTQDMDLIKGYGFEPGKFYMYMSVGSSGTRTDIVKSVQSAIAKMGFTTIEPADADSSEALSKTTVAELCGGNRICPDITKEYIQNNGTLVIYPMSDEQIADAKARGIEVWDQATFASKMKGGNRFKVARSMKQGLNSLADRKSCQTGIELLNYCNTVNKPKLCEDQIDRMEANGLIKIGKTGFTPKINGIKELLGFCVKNKEIRLSGKHEGMLTNLQALSGQYGLATPIVNTQTAPGGRQGAEIRESLNDSIKSVITETINKNNNKNLDSIIKKNLRKYIG